MKVGDAIEKLERLEKAGFEIRAVVDKPNYTLIETNHGGGKNLASWSSSWVRKVKK